jgi:DNA-binding CsgD family transcriptional regulator
MKHRVKIALVTGMSILAVKLLSTLLLYHFFTFDIYLSIVAITFLLAGALLFSGPALPATTNTKLSNRELSVFELLGQGLTNKEIAQQLFIEVSTVKSHINTLYAKTGCRNRLEAREKWKIYAGNQ